MVFLGAVFGVCVESGAGSFGGVSALVTGSGKWLLDPTTQPTIPRTMTTALIATIRNLFMVFALTYSGTHSARKLATLFES